MSEAMSEDAQKLRLLICEYCAALDNEEWDRVESFFTRDAMIKHGSFSGPARQFIGFARDIISQSDDCTHVIESVEVNFEGDAALREAHFSSCHHISGRLERLGPVVTHGVDTEWRVEGRYIDRLKKVDGSWKIFERHGFNDQSIKTPV